MKCDSRYPLILIVLLFSWTKSFSYASDDVSSVIHPSVRFLGEQQCTAQTVDPIPGVGFFTSLQLNKDNGLPVIAYSDSNNLKLASCADATCSNAPVITTVESDGVGGYTSLQLNAKGSAIISYYDFVNQNLKLATFVPIKSKGKKKKNSKFPKVKSTKRAKKFRKNEPLKIDEVHSKSSEV